MIGAWLLVTLALHLLQLVSIDGLKFAPLPEPEVFISLEHWTAPHGSLFVVPLSLEPAVGQRRRFDVLVDSRSFGLGSVMLFEDRGYCDSKYPYGTGGVYSTPMPCFNASAAIKANSCPQAVSFCTSCIKWGQQESQKCGTQVRRAPSRMFVACYVSFRLVVICMFGRPW
jgi:hypothetical protein